MMLPTLTLKSLYHRGKENTGIFFDHDREISNIIKTIKDVRWSNTYKCWYLPLSRQSYCLLKEKVNGKAEIESSLLKKYLEQKKAIQPLIQTEKISKQRALLLMQYPLNQDNLDAFTKYQSMLQLKGYSNNTIKNYSNQFHFMLRLLGKINVTNLTKPHIQ